MKKVVSGILGLVLLVVLTFSVNAWAIAHFNAEGKEYNQTGNMTNSFTQFMQGLQKFSSGTIRVEMDSYKHGLLGIGWTKIGDGLICSFTGGVGALENVRCNYNVSNSGTNEIKSTWQQVSQGDMSADIGR